MRLAPIAITVFLCLPHAIFAEEAKPAEADSAGEIITDMWSNPATCSLATARAVTIDQLVAQSETLRGTCVAVSGYWQGRAIFKSDKEARKDGSNSEKAFAGGRVGLYGYKVLEAQRAARGRYTAVGMAGDCASVVRGTIMVMGYCHYTSGPFIALSQLVPAK
jgi:hypothetical protein